MTVEIASGIQTAVEGIQLAVEHVAGAISLRMVKGEHKERGFGAQFENCL